MSTKSTTEAFLEEMRVRAAKLRGTEPTAPAPISPTMNPYLQAAAVLHVFDPRRLNPASGAARPSKEVLLALITASVPAVGFRGHGLRTLTTPVRLSALTALGSRSAMRAALAANPEREMTGAQEVLETWLNEESFDLGQMTFGELECLQQLYDWEIYRFGDLPDRSTVEQARAWRSSVRVFEHLVDRNFVGRQRELSILRDHVDLVGPRPGPLVISGVGGSGKTALVGRFLIEQFESAGHGSLPFAYLPFDAETLDVREPYTVLLAAARQLSAARGRPQGAANDAVARFQEVVASYRDNRGSLHRRASEYVRREAKIADLGGFERTLYDGFADLVRAELDDPRNATGWLTPALLVFDTFEEVGYRTREDLIGFWGMLDYLLSVLPQLRVVIAGRAPAARPQVSLPTTLVFLTELDLEDSVQLLIRLGITDPETARAIAGQVGGNPLSLRIAADVAKAEGSGHAGLEQRGDTPVSVQAIGAELVRGRLYRRLLDHIHDSAVRALAHPGMVLRRVTPGVIEHVLSPACGLDVQDSVRAAELFQALHQEQALVSLDDDGSLRYREEVRRPVLELLSRDLPAQVTRIHELAVDYYSGLDSTAGRAEELYHRMMLQQPDWQLQDRWLPDVERFITPAIDELPVSQRRWLAGRMSLQLAPEIYQQAELSEWERLIGRKALELVRYGDPRAVLNLTAERAERTPDSPLYAIEARAWLDLREPHRAAALLDMALAGYPVLGNAGRLAELCWLRAQAAGDDPTVRLSFLERLRQLVAEFRSQVAHVQVLTEMLGLLNPDDLADAPNPQVGPVRRELSGALEALGEDEVGQEHSLIRLSLVRLGPHYPALVARLAPSVVVDFGYLVRRGVISVESPPLGWSVDRVEDVIAAMLSDLADATGPIMTAEDHARAYELTRSLLALLRAEKASLSAATLAGIDDYREAWEVTSIEEVAR
jgi:AAA ATPase domain